jgi:hypothetical protein
MLNSLPTIAISCSVRMFISVIASITSGVTRIIHSESHVTRCLVGAVNIITLCFSAVCELFADEQSVLKKGEKHLLRNETSHSEQIANTSPGVFHITIIMVRSEEHLRSLV